MRFNPEAYLIDHRTKDFHDLNGNYLLHYIKCNY